MKKVLKFKQLIIGVIIGILLASTVPITAAIQEYVLYRADYRLFIDGKEYSDKDHPILNYKGSTYCPLRSVLEFSGFDVQWNGEVGIAEANYINSSDNIGTEPASVLPSIKIKNEIQTVILDNMSSLMYTEDELTMIDYNGKQYVFLVFAMKYNVVAYSPSKAGYLSIWMMSSDTIKSYPIDDGSFICFKDSVDKTKAATFISKEVLQAYLTEYGVKY